MRKLKLLLLTVAMTACGVNVMADVPDGYTQIGTSTIYWKYDSTTGHLDIQGTGDMPDFAKSGNIPWNSYRGTGIKTLTIGEGITSIGKNNFYECKAITSISFPSTLTKIGDSQAFINNTALTAIDLSNTKVTYIGTTAFQGCNKAATVILPATLQSVGEKAFYINNTSCVFTFHSNPTFGSNVLYSKKYKEADLVLNDEDAPFVCATTANTFNNASYTRTVGTGYFTLVLPFVPTSGLDDVTLYKMTGKTDDAITFEKETAFEANVPYLAKANEGVEALNLSAASVTIAAPAAGILTAGDWTMQGTYTAVTKTAEDKAYGFTNTALVHNTGNMTVNPFRAYMTYSGSDSKASFGFDIAGDTPTAVTTVDADLSTMQIYNINGVRQSTLQHGINIVKFSNGTTKKFNIK